MTAGRCGVACEELEEYVTAVRDTGMAEEDEETTGRLQYGRGEWRANFKHESCSGEQIIYSDVSRLEVLVTEQPCDEVSYIGPQQSFAPDDCDP